MHNGIDYDVRQINRLLGSCIDPHSCIDTLVLSRLINYNLDGGHSLEAWGGRLGYPKDLFADFSRLSEELVNRCVRDVEINKQLFNQVFRKYYEADQWKRSIDLELWCACTAVEMSENGFPFDYDTGQQLHKEYTTELAKLDKDILDAFPPKPVLVREISPVCTKHGTLHKKDFKWLGTTDGILDLSPFSADCPFSLIEWKEFNPGSTVQIVERLNAAGWQPTEKTKTHIQVERDLRRCKSRTERQKLLNKLSGLTITGWKVSEKNLETLPDTAPEATKLLRQRIILARRISTLEEWFQSYRSDTRSVHGRFNTIGCWTQRFSHTGPNFANIVSTDKPYGYALRSLWRANKDQWLIDVDAEGIQLRVLAHYIDDPQFTEALVNGDKKLGTDAHSLNAKALGDVCLNRDVAKTFIYSWLLGAGMGMTAKVLSCSLSEAKQARENFEDFYPGLKTLKKETIPKDALRGYFQGFDGRKVKCDSEHKMLSGYLQNGESVIMKTAWRIADKMMKSRNLPFKWVNHVHDEYLIVCDKSYEAASRCLDIMKFAIKRAGEVLELKCPMAGSGTFGINWADIH